MNLEEMRIDCAIKQKKGLHFMLSSILIWLSVLIIHSTSLPILNKNLLTFCFTAPLMPLAFIISKMIKVQFNNKSNPLTNLGVIFAINQMLYLIIAMWIFNAVPEKMVMVIAMIFGAHLMPFGWLYKSKSYFVFSIIIPIVSLIIGQSYNSVIISLIMILFQVIFCITLSSEIKSLNKADKKELL